jgi:hypothetical protein
MYIFLDMETAVKEAVRKAKISGGKIPDSINYGDGFVVNTGIPHDLDVDGAGQIWLTYASACYFKHITTNRLEVPWVLGVLKGTRIVGLDETILRRAQWSTYEQSPQLPVNIAYLSELSDFTNGYYFVNSYSNYQDLTLPLQSTFDVYVRTQGDTSNIRRMYRYVVKADSFKAIESGFEFPPRVPFTTAVVDCRFSKSAQLPYNVTNRFLTKTEARETPYFASAILRSDVSQGVLRSSGYQRLVLLTMAGVTMIFLAILVKKSLQKSEKATTNK